MAWSMDYDRTFAHDLVERLATRDDPVINGLTDQSPCQGG
jgi:ornithine carbamoyltransferase